MLRLVYLQPPNYFLKEKREEAHSLHDTRLPSGLKNVSPIKKVHRTDNYYTGQ